MYETITSLSPVVVLILVHLFVGRVRFLDPKPDSPWLSAAAGTAIAYVFVYLLPKLAVIQVDFGSTLGGPVYTYLRHHVYLVALVGFTFFFWTMWADEFARLGLGGRPAGSRPGVLTLKVVGLTAYCMQMGYLIADVKRPGLVPVMIATGILVFHFLGLDNGFRRHHQELYDNVVRWVFAAAMLAGWLVGALTQVHLVTVGLWSAFVGGGIIITALREELPNEGDTRFVPFLAGVVVTTVLILTVEKLLKP